MSTTSLDSSAAQRQKQFREDARAEFNVIPYSFLLRSCEAEFLRDAFVRKFGHAMSIRARRKHAEKAKVQTKSGNEQLALL